MEEAALGVARMVIVAAMEVKVCKYLMQFESREAIREI